MKTVTIDIPANTALPAKVIVTIPDVVGGVQPDPTWKIIPAGGPSKPFTLPVIPYSDTDFLRPLCGAKQFYGSIQAVAVPTDANPVALDNEKRFNWTELQVVDGSYTWEKFDSWINSSIDKGQRCSFGIGMLSTNSQYDGAIVIGRGLSGYAKFVHDAMQNEVVKDWIPEESHNMWVPNWNSQTLMASWQKFLKALYAHIMGTAYKTIQYRNVISMVHLAGYGLYGGEWHTAGAGRNNPNIGARKATAATLKNFIDAYRTVFNEWPLVIPINAVAADGNGEIPLEVCYYALTAKNAWGDIGWANFHIGTNEKYAEYEVYKNVAVYNGIPLKPLIVDKYKYAPIAGEPMNNESAQTSGGMQFGLFEQQIRDYHISNFNNSFTYKNPALNAGGLQNFRNGCKASGYRLQVNGGAVSGKQISLDWSNTGIAPIYENWDVWFEIRNGAAVAWAGKSSFNPKLFLPGTKSVIDTIGDKAGDLYLIIKDPAGYRKPLPLANKGREADGSYKLLTL